MTTQTRLTIVESDFKIKKSKKTLTPKEKFYKNVHIRHHSTILYPGRFGTSKIDCGKFKFAYSCGCGKLTKAVHKSCNNLNCPKCSPIVIRRSSKRIAQRGYKVLQLLKRSGKQKPFFNHITFGPSKENFPEILDYLEFKKFKEKYLRIIKKYNGSGVLIFHAYRKKRIEIEIPWKTDSTKKKVRESFILRYSPHFHLIGNIWIPRNHFREKGWIIKKIKDKKTNQIIKLRKEKSIYSTVRYLLTHATYYENTKQTSWIGKYSSYYMIKKNERFEYKEIICESCEGLAYRIKAEPRNIDDDYIYFYQYCLSYLDYDFPPLRKKVKLYDLEYRDKKKMKNVQ